MSSLTYLETMVDSNGFAVVNDISYERMMKTLNGGEKFVKSYAHTCAAKNTKKCKCEFSLNYLHDNDGQLVRDLPNGKIISVLSLSQFQLKKMK